MFDKKQFAQILKKINETYDSQRDFAKKSKINRTYLSQYMNMKLNEPPKPAILQKLADSSNNIISYAQLMEVCGYIDVYTDIPAELIRQKTEYIVDNTDYLLSSGLDNEQIFQLQNIVDLDFSSKEYQEKLDSFLSTLPLETSYIVLKLLQNMLSKLKEDANEKVSLAHELKLETDELLQKVSLEDLKKLSDKNKLSKIPILGTVKAGYDWLAEENVVDYITLKENLPNIKEYYALKITGDSMLPLLSEGDLVIIHSQDDVESGQTAVVLINGEEATVKKVIKTSEGIELHSMNPYYPVKKFNFEDMKNIPVKIIGRVKEAKIKGAFE